MPRSSSSFHDPLSGFPPRSFPKIMIADVEDRDGGIILELKLQKFELSGFTLDDGIAWC